MEKPEFAPAVKQRPKDLREPTCTVLEALVGRPVSEEWRRNCVEELR
jgi:hypothetical protein